MSADPTSSDVLGLKNSLARPKPEPAAAAGRRSPENAASLDNTSLPANQPYYGAEYGIGLRPDVLKQSQKNSHSILGIFMSAGHATSDDGARILTILSDYFCYRLTAYLYI